MQKKLASSLNEGNHLDQECNITSFRDRHKEFMSYFVKPDVLEKCKRGKHFLELSLKTSLLPKELMFIGFKAKKLIQKLGSKDSDVVKFLSKVEESYLKCGEYIQNKLPLENSVLKALSVIDPLLMTSSSKNKLKRLSSLPIHVTIALTEEQESKYDQEIRAVCIDSNLPAALDVDGNEIDCLKWWTSVSDRYPVILVMIQSVLSIFHGPRVESTFNVMGDVIDKNSGRMNMETYSAIQDVKYGLKTRKPLTSNRAVKVFSRANRHFTPINPQLSNNMRKAYKKYNAVQKKNKEEEEELRKKFNVEHPKNTSAKKLKEDTAALAEKESREHQEILARAYNLKRFHVQDVDVVQAEPVEVALSEVVSEPEVVVPEAVVPEAVVPKAVVSETVVSEAILSETVVSNKNTSKRGPASSQISQPPKKRKKSGSGTQKSISGYFKAS